MNESIIMNLLLKARFTRSVSERIIKENRVAIWDDVDEFVREWELDIDELRNGYYEDIETVIYNNHEYVLVYMFFN